MSAKHTQGPFAVRVSSFNSSVFEVTSAVDSSLTGIPTVPVVAVVHSAYYGPEVARANADLFASAPDMLAVLIKTLGFLELYHKDYRYPGDGKCDLSECCWHCGLVSDIIKVIGPVPSVHEGI